MADQKQQMKFMQIISSEIVNFVGLRFFTVYGPYGRPDMVIYLQKK